MDRQKFITERQWIRDQLTNVADFWLKNGMDHVHGGVYTCLDRTGKIFSTDKSVWMQGRCGWTYAYLCNIYGVKEEWLAASKSCIDFLEKYCVNHAAGGRLYFTVTEDGQPLRQRRYCFSEAFYCIANAEYYGLTGEREYLDRARRAYDMYWNLNHGMKDPTGMGPKTSPETRTGRSLGIPMINLNVTGVMKRVDPEMKDVYDERAKECVADIFNYHVKPELGCTLESVGLEGEARLNITEGRMVNPGHDIECSWFLMDYANTIGDAELHSKAINVFDMAFNMGWDKEYGGIFYFKDIKGAPMQKLEWDQKLWWVHIESAICFLKGYQLTGNEQCLEWFQKIHDYMWAHFKDAEYPEWYGYLNRRGEVLLTLKGGKWKGCFHVPRGLYQIWQMLETL